MPKCRMEREKFVAVVGEVLDALPKEFRDRIHNVAVLVEDRAMPMGDAPANADPSQPRCLILGMYQGLPATQRSVFDLYTGPHHIILYQRNIEAICHDEAEIRHQIRQTLLHELGHYFGMSEAQLRDV